MRKNEEFDIWPLTLTFDLKVIWRKVLVLDEYYVLVKFHANLLSVSGNIANELMKVLKLQTVTICWKKIEIPKFEHASPGVSVEDYYGRVCVPWLEKSVREWLKRGFSEKIRMWPLNPDLDLWSQGHPNKSCSTLWVLCPDKVSSPCIQYFRRYTTLNFEKLNISKGCHLLKKSKFKNLVDQFVESN